MKRKSFFLVLVLILIITTALTAVACKPVTYQVSFDLNYETTTAAPTTITVVSGDKAIKPTDPTREGYFFGGWYTNADTTASFSFDSAIAGDTVLYAKWTLDTVTVSFNLNDVLAAGMPSEQVIGKGGYAVVPTVPTLTGYNFGGWYLDAANKVIYNFNSAVNDDVVLYARWSNLVNDTAPLVIGTSTMDGVFSPYFATVQYDVDIATMTQISLIGNDKFGAPVAGDEWATLAKSFSIDTDTQEGYSIYNFVLKNNVYFSTGEQVTAEDVLFNFYVFCDPKYDGASTLYSTPIVGLQAYRNQVADEESIAGIVAGFQTAADTRYDNAAAAWINPTGASADTLADLDNLVDYISGYIAEDVAFFSTPSMITAYYSYTGLPNANYPAWMYAPAYYGVIGYSASTQTINFKDTGWTLESTPSVEEVNAEILEYCSQNYAPDVFDEYFGWTASSEFANDLLNDETQTYLTEHSGVVSNISGITAGTTTIGSETYETVTIRIKGVDPKAIWNFGLQIAPMNYYGGTYAAAYNGTDNFGLAFNSADFMAELKAKNGAPVGAGPYKMSTSTGSGTPTAATFFVNGVVYFEKNASFLMGSPKIKYVRYKTIASGQEYAAVLAGEVHYSQPSAKSTTIDEITAGEGDAADLAYILVDNLGYGYIGINASLVPDLNVRKAVMSAMDRSKILEYYPNGLATIIERSMSKVSWAYPDGAEAYYPYGQANVSSYLAAAGYALVGNELQKEGVQLELTFTVPQSMDHPVAQVFLSAKTLLEGLGAKINVVVDTNWSTNLNAGTLQIWGAAWQATIDPDMFQVYSEDSTATSVIGYGIPTIKTSGSAAEKLLLHELSVLIQQARECVTVEERAPIYEAALDKLMDLAIELPTYQRKNMFVYNDYIIDVNSLTASDDITPYWGPLAEIWNVSLTANAAD